MGRENKNEKLHSKRVADNVTDFVLPLSQTPFLLSWGKTDKVMAKAVLRPIPVLRKCLSVFVHTDR